MTTRIILTGATGWVGRALVPAITDTRDLALVGAVARSAAGRDLGEAIGTARLGVMVSASLAEALKAPADVLIDYTHPDVVKHHVLQALAHGLHVVIGTSGLGADDLGRIDTAARAQQRGVVAAGNFSITATLLKLFALTAARSLADVEIIDYAPPGKPDTPSGTARELAEVLSAVRQPPLPGSRSTILAAFARRGAERSGRSSPFRCTRSACPRTCCPARLSSAHPTSA